MTFTPRHTTSAGQAARRRGLGRHRWGQLSLVAVLTCLSVLMGTAPGAYAEEPAASPSASPSAAPTPTESASPEPAPSASESAAPTPTDSASPEPAPTQSPAGDPSPVPSEPAPSQPAPAPAPSPEPSAPPAGGTSANGSESLPAAAPAQINCGDLQDYCDAVLGPVDLRPLVETVTQLVQSCLGAQAASTQSTSANLDCGLLVATLRQAALDAVDTVLACANGSNETCAAVIQLVLRLAGEATGCANALGAGTAPGNNSTVDCAALAAQLNALANELVALVVSCANRTEPTCSTAYDLANGAVATVVKCATDFLAGIGDFPAAATGSASTSSSVVPLDCYPLGVLVGDTVDALRLAAARAAGRRPLQVDHPKPPARLHVDP